MTRKTILRPKIRNEITGEFFFGDEEKMRTRKVKLLA